MSFSRLILVAANSKKCIVGEGKDKVCVSAKLSLPGRDAYEGEVVLCFQLDDRADLQKRVPRSLGIPDSNQRCDGLVFYSQDEKAEKIVCLVEMKSMNIGGAEDQLISTKEHIEQLLRKECAALPESCQADCRRQITNIIWKACIYHHGASPDEFERIQKRLRENGFTDFQSLTSADHDLRPLLSGEGISAKEMGKSTSSVRSDRVANCEA